MYLIDNSTAVATMPTPGAAGTGGWFTSGDAASGEAATIVDADWLNMLQAELAAILTAGGITPSKATQNQVLAALKKVFPAYGAVSLGAWTEQYYTLASGGSKSISLSFTAPCAGYVIVVGSANFSAQNTSNSQLSIGVNGTTLSADNVSGSTSMTNHSCVAVAAGAVTVSSYLGTSSTSPPTVGHTLSYLFVPS